MLILHGGFESGLLVIWGEQPAGLGGAQPTGSTSKGSRRKTGNSRPLIYDAGREPLLGALSIVLPDFDAIHPPAEVLTAWIPSAGGQPIPSSPLIAEPPETKLSSTKLEPWLVTGYRLPFAMALELLSACAGRQTLAPGIVVGRDLEFWIDTMRLAGTLVARQQFLPTVDLAAPAPRAQWEPVLTAQDRARLERLSRIMPNACRALSAGGGNAAAKSGAHLALRSRDVLDAFINGMVDSIVRLAVSPARAGSAEPGKRKGQAASVHDRWFAALRSAGGSIAGQATELSHLAQQLAEWRRPVSIADKTPFRLCFRLEEPELKDQAEGSDSSRQGSKKRTRRQSEIGLSETVQSTQAPWQVRYLLQAADDPSLLVPVTEVWSAGGARTPLLHRAGFNPKEYLLSSLGQAARVSTDVERSLRVASPSGYSLDSTGAFEFLQQQAWLLEQSGFGILLPAWWTRRGTKQRLTARAHVKSPSMHASAGLSLDDVVTFDWEVVLGNEKLSGEELEMLARMKSPLVRLRGQWVQLNSAEIEAALAFWKKRGQGKATAREIVRMSLGAGTGPEGFAVEGVVATGWVGEMLAQLEGGNAFEEIAPPAEFRGTLRPYQLRGYSWLSFLRRWGLGACLADDMGLGKTPQSLALIQQNWNEKDKRPVLVVCPTSVVGNWQKEADRFTPDLPVMVHHGLTRARGAAFKKAAGKHAIVLSSFSLLHRDIEILKQVDWAGVILDEAQNIKNSETRQAQAARSLAAGYRIALTGTPVENNIGDLWSIMEFLNPGLLGTQAEFKRSFFLPIQSNRDARAAKRLKRLTGPFILRRLKTDKSIISDLPDKIEMKVFCTLTKEQASLYAAVVDDVTRSLEEAEGIQRKGIVLATLSKLKQVCNHPAQFLGDNSAIPGRSGKLARLTEMLEEVQAEGDRALVFTQFAEMGEIIRIHLQETFGREVLFLHGGVSKKRRDLMVSRFQNESNGPTVFVLSLKAGGTGLNLTKASHVFHFDRWWNPAVENQATDRAFRIGQSKNVQVHKFLCAGTLEEKIDEMIERKQELAAMIVGTGESWLTELSTSALKELFALRPEAVAE